MYVRSVLFLAANNKGLLGNGEHIGKNNHGVVIEQQVRNVCLS